MTIVYKVTKSVTVTNANGTAEKKCSTCGAWLEHWEEYSSYVADKCSVENCDNDAVVGAHVLRPNANKENYKTRPYIIPMCKAHNGKSSSEKMKTKTDIDFVWANVKETCGR